MSYYFFNTCYYSIKFFKKGVTMRGKNLIVMGVLVLICAGDAMAQSVGLAGTSGNYSVSGTDTFGLKEILVKLANVVSDDGLNKIVGFGGTLAGATLAYQKNYIAGAMTAVVSMIVGYLPKFVDSAYGLLI